jgi:hypothetical protein
LELAIELPRAAKGKLDDLEPKGLAELGATWVDPAMSHRDIAEVLVQFGIAVARSHGMPNLVSLGSQHSIPLALRMGFLLDPSEPVFRYPDARYQSRLAWSTADRSLSLGPKTSRAHEGASR